MKFITIISVFFASCLAFSGQVREFSTAELDNEFEIAIKYMMQNISRVDGARGSVVAAPSRSYPDYYYHWVRDAALTMEAVMDLYQNRARLDPSLGPALKRVLLDHLHFNQVIQNNSSSQAGLGEPKFYIDGLLYTDPWGRPQNDGPALRAASMLRLLNIAYSERWPELAQIRTQIYDSKLPTQSVAKADLEYSAHHWLESHFDIWEESWGHHFYSLLAQRKALALGSQMADQLGDTGALAFYQNQFQQITQELGNFWSPEKGYIVSTRQGVTLSINKSYLDSAVLLAILHNNLNDGFLQLTDSRVVATFQKLKSTFSNLYSINQRNDLGTAFGRYPEDTYDGYQVNSVGNPWVLTTLAAAEYYYRSAEEILQQDLLKITSSNKKFFEDLDIGFPVITGQTINKSSGKFDILVQKMIEEGDRQMARVLFHKNADGSLSEQMNRNSGFMTGAPHLTWSYASFITAKLARDRVVPIFSKSNLNKNLDKKEEGPQ